MPGAPYGDGVGPGWYGVWTGPVLGGVCPTGGNTEAPTPWPLCVCVPGTMLGGAAWKD
ncbi:hypothetical protein RKD41_003759 [Streptomyces tendae]